MTTKFNVGDKVRIKIGLETPFSNGTEYFMENDKDEVYGYIVIEDMLEHQGRIAIITDIIEFEDDISLGYEIDIDDGDCVWVDEMFEETIELQFGNIVKVKEDLVIGTEYGVIYTNTFVTPMEQYKGDVGVITFAVHGNYKTDIDSGEWGWTSDMFDLVSSSNSHENENENENDEEDFEDWEDDYDFYMEDDALCYGCSSCEDDEDWDEDDEENESDEFGIFKVGDEVVIREDLVVGEAYEGENQQYQTFVGSMREYLGKKAIIQGKNDEWGYDLNIDNGKWRWTDDMLTSPSPKHKFKVGDRVFVRDDLIVNITYPVENGNPVYFSSSMVPYEGLLGKVISLEEGWGYRLEFPHSTGEKRPPWTWTDDMLLPISSSETDTTYKVDDIVRIDLDLEEKCLYYMTHSDMGMFVSDEMIALKGKTAKIVSIVDIEDTLFGYLLDIDEEEFVWTDDMFTDVGLEEGDIVRVREDLISNKEYYDGCYFASNMVEFKGKVAKITAKTKNRERYHINIDGERWFWTHDMLDLVADYWDADDYEEYHANLEEDEIEEDEWVYFLIRQVDFDDFTFDDGRTGVDLFSQIQDDFHDPARIVRLILEADKTSLTFSVSNGSLLFEEEFYLYTFREEEDIDVIEEFLGTLELEDNESLYEVK